MRVALLVTCVADVFEPEVAEATVEVLTAGGCEVSCPQGQTCCGQPAWNAGFAADAARVAGTTLAALGRALDDGAEAVVVPAGSCAAMVRRFWPELFHLHGTPDQVDLAVRVADRTWELTELVPHLDLPPLALPEPTTVAWHHSCHLLRELRHTSAADVLDAVEGCDRTAWAADERCCGFGGLFSVKLPEVSVAMADDKVRSLLAADPRPDEVVSADASCLLHLRGRMASEGVAIRTRHVAQVLADALPAAGPLPADGPSEPSS
ncbi:(Fe-S)-binding protein [Aquihabitans sp. G128]|uniref:(Fe-S)-binding protein n=1 Tax=Aquihabitans sp. G128 TaxID=2849779 RepID=UPI001C212309|nr:(Fe-S)-binding protein [Aquihabitans sp. G128]QXC62882.1 (Fe-S)-binding protein [Aquihabitans sp. G128]